MVVGQSIQGGLDQPIAFGPLQGQGRVAQDRVIRWIDRFLASRTVKSARDPPTATTTQGQVDGDSINPGVERTLPLKSIQFFEGPKECILQKIDASSELPVRRSIVG